MGVMMAILALMHAISCEWALSVSPLYICPNSGHCKENGFSQSAAGALLFPQWHASLRYEKIFL